MAWLSGWSKRKKITLTGGTSGSSASYQMNFDVVYDSDMKSDFSDLRFTELDETTVLDSWMESYIASTSAVVWVETDTPANGVDSDVYMYYGNSGAESDWSVSDTFLSGDDFEDVHDYITGGDDRAAACPPNNKSIRVGSKTHIIYAKGSSHGIYVRTYDHSTISWGNEVTIASSCNDNHACPTIVVDSNGYLYVFYDGHHTTMKWRKSTNTNDSSSWTTSAALPNQATSPTYPSAVVDDSNNIHLIYRDTGPAYLSTYYQQYDGSTWSSNITLFQGSTNYHACYHCSLAIDSNDVIHAVAHWERIVGDTGESIGYAKSTDGGSTWKESDDTPYSLPITQSAIETLQTGTDIRAENIAVNGDDEPIIYVCDRTTSPYSGKLWRYTGGTWVSTDVSVSGKDVRQGGTCAFYDGITYIFLHVGTSRYSDDCEVFIFYSDDNGATFGQKQISTTDATEPNWSPNAERNAGHNPLSGMCVMWQNGATDGATDIYFAKINSGYDADNYNFDYEGDVSGWIEDGVLTGGDVSSESSVVEIGEYSTKHIFSTATTAFLNTIGTINSDVAIEFYKRSAATDDDCYHVLNQGATHDGTKQVSQIAFYNDGNIKHFDTAWQTIMAYSADTWYRFKLCNFNFTAYTYDIYIDDMDTPKVTGAAFKNSLSYFDNFEIMMNDPGAVEYIDMLFVRKHVSNPATYVFGSEEDASTILTLIHLYNQMRA